VNSDAQHPIRGTGQHRDLVAEQGGTAVSNPPEAGSIAVLPRENAQFTDAVRAGGGTVAPLSDDTRGVVWLSYQRASELGDVLAAHPRIGWVQLPWAGVDAFAPVLAQFAGSVRPLWTSAKGAYSEPVAEQALMLALALLREVPQRSVSTSWAKDMTGTSLYGKNVVIVGAGGIALELVRLLSVFDARITIVRRTAATVAGTDRTVTADQLLDVLPDADVVVIAAASTNDTRSMFGAEEFAAMKSSAVLVNIARGALIDTDALVAALETGQIASAGLDVTFPEPLPDGHPLWNLPNCVITSHSADTPAMTAPLLAHRVKVNVEAFLGHGKFVGIVDPAAGY
jgi:phosphoglycerate dehydrogenase-like enzyme